MRVVILSPRSSTTNGGEQHAQERKTAQGKETAQAGKARKTAEEKKRPLSAGLHRREDLYQIRPYDAEGRASVLSGQPDQYLGAVLRQHRDQDPSSDDGAFVDPRY